MLRLFLVFGILLHSINGISQRPKFYATVDARTIVEGSYVQVKFTLEDANGTNFTPPPFDGFKIVSGPSNARSTSIVNGVSNSSVTISYGLQASRLGSLSIGQASIKVGRQTMKTDPISVKVVKGSTAPVNKNEKYFIEVSVTDSIAYVGQQIILDYKLYTVYDVRQTKFLSELNFDGFYKEVLTKGRRGFKREVLNGKEYHSKNILRVALFPQQTGTYEIPPQNVELGIATSQTRGFFFSANLVKERLLVRGQTIRVKEMPANQANASGAVGRYSMEVSLAKKTISTDEAITLFMQVVGNGDSKTVIAPTWELPEGLEMYDPNVLEDETFKTEDQISHRKTFEYLIVAKEPGLYNLKPTFNYFNTDSLKSIALSNEIRGIRVIKGSNSPVVNTEKKLELASIKPIDKLRKRTSSHYHSLLHFGLLGFTLASAIGIFLYGERLKKSGKLDPEVIKRNKAYNIARTRLEGARSYLDENKSKEFYEEIIIALKKYLTDKKNIPALHMKKSELLSQLKAQSISENTVLRFNAILNKAELAMYAPGMGSSDKETYQEALDLIQDLEAS